MAQLTQTISNLVGILLGLVGAVGVGFFIYGAYLYLTASGAPHQMERGKSAMLTAVAGIVLAMVAYGIVGLVMNAVVSPAVTPSLPVPTTPSTGG
ncbi:MAG: pilin [bacterium]|nr:pilin [bacterium]MCY3951885.1 pilin [bacterium]